MASLSFPKSPKKGPSIQWYDRNGDRQTLYLGKCPKRWAEEFARCTERLIEHSEFGEPIDRKTSEWLTELAPKWKVKLAAKGLVEAQAISTLGDLVDDCRTKLVRDGAAEATIYKLDIAAANLFEHFGEGRSLHSITPADAVDYAAWVRRHGRRDGRDEELSPTTTAKQLKTVSGLFRRAVEKEVARRNPFRGVIHDVSGADAQQYVPITALTSVLSRCEPELALRVALTRFAGLRHPSEVDALKIEWVNIDERRLLVYSPKNSRYPHKRWREVPIDPALFPYVEEAIERAPIGAVYLAHHRRGVTSTAWRQALLRACQRAAVVPWRSLWHSLRGSRAVDLLDSGVPEHVVCTWQNTGPKELRKHYLRPTGNHFSSITGLAAQPAEQAEPRIGEAMASRIASAESHL